MTDETKTASPMTRPARWLVMASQVRGDTRSRTRNMAPTLWHEPGMGCHQPDPRERGGANPTPLRAVRTMAPRGCRRRSLRAMERRSPHGRPSWNEWPAGPPGTARPSCSAGCCSSSRRSRSGSISAPATSTATTPARRAGPSGSSTGRSCSSPTPRACSSRAVRPARPTPATRRCGRRSARSSRRCRRLPAAAADIQSPLTSSGLVNGRFGAGHVQRRGQAGQRRHRPWCPR